MKESERPDCMQLKPDGGVEWACKQLELAKRYVILRFIPYEGFHLEASEDFLKDIQPLYKSLSKKHPDSALMLVEFVAHNQPKSITA